MAKSKDVEAIEKSAQRFENLLDLSDFSQEDKINLRSAPDFDTFSKILGPKFQDHLGLWRSREAYLGRVLPAQEAADSSSKKGAENLSSDFESLGALGLLSIGALGATAFIASTPAGYNVEDLEKEAQAYAEGKSKYWSGNKSIMTAANEQDAYEKARNEYYDYFVQEKPELAKRLAREKRNRFLDTALAEAETRKLQRPNQDTRVVSQESVNRIKAIEVASSASSAKFKRNQKTERIDMLRAFGSQETSHLSATLAQVGVGELQFNKEGPRVVPIKKTVVRQRIPVANHPFNYVPPLQRNLRAKSRRPGFMNKLSPRNLLPHKPKASDVVSAGAKWAGAVPIAIFVTVLVIFLLLISVVGVLGHASEDPQFAQQTGLDAVFSNNSPSGAPGQNPNPTGTGGNPEVDCADPDKFFSDNNIGVLNITSPSKKQLLCQNLSVLLSYPEIDRYLTGKRIIFDSSATSGCPDFADGCTHVDAIRLINFNNSNASDSHWSAIINHEFFHALDNISGIENGYQDPYSSDKDKCYDITDKGYYIISSYGKQFAAGLSSKAVRDESFAESGALYVTGKGTDGTIANFNINCPGNSGFWSDTIGEPSVPSDPTLGTGDFCTKGVKDSCSLTQYDKYMSKNPTGLNFGDPSCELASGGSIDRQKVRNEILRQLQTNYPDKTKDYCRWSCIAFHEAGYNPNSYNSNSPRAIGAWGMFQMTPYACYGLTSKPYKYNRSGNVAWRDQISRALRLEYVSLETHGISWNYWSTARNCVRGKFKPAEPDWNGSLTSPNCVDIGN